MPTISISLPEDTYARLTCWAADRNQTLEEAVAPVLAELAPAVPSLGDRQKAFEELTRLIQSRAHRYPPGFRVDDRHREEAAMAAK